jgi:hypothetical protein
METKICSFEQNNITFLLSKDNGMMINATEMAKPFNKQVVAFLRNDDTKNFITECLKSENSHYLGIKKEEDLLISSQKSGTLMHRVLALKFAAWLSPKFELWIYSTIERLLFGKHVDRENSFKKTVSLQKEMNMLAEKPQKTGEDFERYMVIRNLLRVEKTIRTNLTKESVSEMNDLFQEDEED